MFRCIFFFNKKIKLFLIKIIKRYIYFSSLFLNLIYMIEFVFRKHCYFISDHTLGGVGLRGSCPSYTHPNYATDHSTIVLMVQSLSTCSRQTLLFAKMNHLIHFSQQQCLFITSLTTSRKSLFAFTILFQYCPK